MPRQARLDAPGVLHHVMARGIERGVVFRDDADREDFVQRLAQAVGLAARRAEQEGVPVRGDLDRWCKL